MAEFLSENQCLEYYAKKAGVSQAWEDLGNLSITKAFPGRHFVMFSKLKEQVTVHGIYKVQTISMDKGGLCLFLKESKSPISIRVGYEPVTLKNDHVGTVLVSIPTRCTVERTLRKKYDRITESTAIGLLVKQDANPAFSIAPGVLMFMGYTEFKKKTGREITELEN